MTTLTTFDGLVLVGLVLLVAVWLWRRIRSSLKASCCSTDTSSCVGCSGGCSRKSREQAGACGRESAQRDTDNKKPD